MWATTPWSPRAIAPAAQGLRWADGIRALARHLPAWLAGKFAGPAGLEASADAIAVRELAYRYRLSDPGFAADLYAAAYRHEGAAVGGGLPRRPTRD